MRSNRRTIQVNADPTSRLRHRPFGKTRQTWRRTVYQSVEAARESVRLCSVAVIVGDFIYCGGGGSWPASLSDKARPGLTTQNIANQADRLGQSAGLPSVARTNRRQLHQSSRRQSKHIGRTSCRGLVQSIFSSPSRRSRFPSFPKCVAPRRWAKNALHYAEHGIMQSPSAEVVLGLHFVDL